MSVQAILAPLFVQVALVLALLYGMAWLRTADVRSRRVHPRDIALGESKWPLRTTQFANAFRNQFELPVLFYVLTVLALFTKQADLLFVVLAWIFVLTRLAHAYVHVTSNRVTWRGAVYGVGALVLTLMWVMFMVRILLAGA
jgi:hypothetical protein